MKGWFVVWKSINRRRSGATSSVLEDRVQRSSKRRATLTFWVAFPIVGLLAMLACSDRWNPVIAMFAGAAIGFGSALVIAFFVLIWPILRGIWWWSLEIIFGAGLVEGWVQLATHTGMLVRCLVVATVVGVPAGVPWLRRKVAAIFWCDVDRHRIRHCFNAFIISNRTGSLPLILWAKPTDAGERVWVHLRPGLSMEDVQARADQLAAGCWAAAVTVEVAGESNSAYLRIDIKRRDALTAVVDSPLVGMVDPNTPETDRAITEIPDALDFDRVSVEDVTPIDPVKANADAKKARADKKTEPATRPEPVAVSAGGEDVSAWVD